MRALLPAIALLPLVFPSCSSGSSRAPRVISATLSTITATPQSGVVADGATASTITVTVLDSNGVPFPGRAVVLSATGSGNTLTQPGVSDVNGLATGTLASTVATTKTVTAIVDPGPNQVTLTATVAIGFIANAGSVSPSQSTVAASPATGVIADGTATSTITIMLVDGNGNPVPGQTVQLSSSGNSNTLAQPSPTNASGITTGTIASTMAEVKSITATVNPGAGQVIVTQQPTITFVGDTNNISAANSTLSASPTTDIIANDLATSTISVVVRDINGNALAGHNVQFSSNGSNNTITQPGTTNASGASSGTIATTTAETKTITATVNPGSSQVVVTQQPTVAFIGDPATVDAGTTTITMSPATGVVADGSTTSTATVTVRDVNGNPVSAQVVALASTGFFNSISPTTVISDASGVATPTITSIRAETKTISATINPGPSQVAVTAQPTVVFIGDASNISAGSSTASAVPATGVAANGAAVSTVSVTLVDINGNAVAGQTVQLASDGILNTIVQPAVTNSSGSTSGTLATTAAELKTITVTANPGAGQVILVQKPTIGFVGNAANLSAAGSSVIATPSSGVVANGTTLSTVTITVRDSNGNPVPGQTVQLTATGTGNTLTQPVAATDSNGVATGTVASTGAATKVVTATVNPGGSAVVLSQQPTVIFIGDASTISAGNSSSTASPTTGVIANDVDLSTVSVTVRDANNNPVAGQAVQFAATGTGNTLTQPAISDANGLAVGTIASSIAETKTITATINPGGTPVIVTQQPTVAFDGDPANVSPGLSTVVASPTSNILADGSATSTITITVLDGNSNPLAGLAVQIASTGTGNTLTQPASVTNASGVATGTIATTNAEIKTVSISVDPSGTAVSLSSQPTVTFIGNASTISASNSAATAAPGNGIAADGSTVSTITVIVRDSNGNPVAGQTVQLASSGTNNTITQPASVTDTNGLATGTIATTTAETKTIAATINPGGTPVVVTQQPTATFIGDAAGISAGSSTATASPTSGVVADGSNSSTITVTVIDGNGNPVAGQTVQLASNGSNNSITQPASVTKASGVATGTIASTTAETKTITVTINPGGTPVIVTQQPTVAFAGDPSTVSPGLSSVSVSPGSNVTADGSTTSTITVTVRDSNGNVVPGRTVLLASTGSNNTIAQPASVTNASGVATGTIASTTAETKTISVTVDSASSAVALVTQPTVGFIGNVSTISAANSTVNASQSISVVADGSTTSTITVTVLDANSNPVAGQSVQLASNGSNNTITQPASVTNASGVATGTIATTTAETKTITATINPSGTPVVVTQQPTVAFIGDASTISASNSMASASPTSGVTANGSDSSTITVTVLDANSNPVSGQSVQIAANGSNNSITQPASVTNASGVATATITTSTAETKTITATVNPSGTPVVITQQPTVTFAGNPASISASNSTASTSPSTGVSADGTTTSTITITVRDSSGNVVSGQTVQLASTGTNNTITQPASVTNAGGVATGAIATTTAETKTITATINPGGSQVVISQQPTVGFVALVDLDDARLAYGEGVVAAVQQRLWDNSGSSWSAEAGTSTTSATIQSVINAIRPIGWYRDTWTKRKQITIDSTQVSGSQDLQNFPVLISITDSDIAASALTNGNDILFTAGNGTSKLPHQIESYVSGSGNLVAWVKLPILSPSSDTTIYLYYGNGSASDQQNITSVWDNDFSAVWHLGGSYDGTAGEVLDATSNNNDGLAGTAPSRVSGRIGFGQDFEAGSTQYLTVDHSGRLDFAGASDTLTFSAWIRPESIGAWQAILSKGASSPFDQWFGLRNSIPADVGFELNSSALDSTSTLNSGEWTHLAVTWDHVDMRVHVNGILDSSTLARSTNLVDSSNTSTIGANVSGGGDPFDGIIDELRVSSVVRSNDWITTEFNNQSAPNSFFSVGSETTFATDDGEELIAVLADTGAGTTLDMLRNAGGVWSVDWTATSIAQAQSAKRGFGLSYEDVSGDALVVHSNNSATPGYRTRSGGSWSAEQPLPINDGAGHNPDPNTGVVRWVELVSRPGTNEIALGYLDANNDLVVMIWDGSQWLTSSATVLDATIKINAVTAEISNRAFDLAYEWNTGRLLAAWAREGSVGFWYATKEPGAVTWATATAVTTAPAGGITHYVDLASEPHGKRIAGGFFDMGDGTERLGLATWDGTAWVNAGEPDSQTRNVNDTATGDFAGAVGWLGTSGTAVCVYPDNGAGALDWALWTAGGGWVLQTDVVVAGKGFTESVQIASSHGSNQILVILSDSASDLWALTYDGSTWTVTNTATALETGLSTVDAAPFHLAIKPH